MLQTHTQTKHSGGLTIVPTVPRHGAPAEGGPRPPYIFGVRAR